MKKLQIISVLILLSNIILGQENNWMDSILNRVILNEIVVYDKEFKPIKNDAIDLIVIDTVVNCQWTRPKFVNNIFQSSFDGVLVEDQVDFDTSTNKIDSKYLDFTIQQFDENGNYLKDTIVFLVNKENYKKHDLAQDIELVNNLKNTYWQNDRIELGVNEIELDSCHNIFRLQLNEGFTFYQFYGNNQSDCSTYEMRKEKQVGVEGDSESFFKYYNKTQGHYLSLLQGNWLIEKNELQLIDVQKRKALIFKIEKLNDEELHLKLKETNYRIKMKKSSR
jgi:hypothetical protein